MPANPKIAIQLFESARQPISAGFKSRVRINDGHHQAVHDKFVTGPPPLFEVPFFNNFGDDYTVIVTASQHRDAGFFPVKVALGQTPRLDLMLMPKKSRYNFAQAAWDKLKKSDPDLVAILARGVASEQAARSLYDKLLDGLARQQDALASLHNITTALKAVNLPVGKPLDYFKQLIWEGPQAPQRDRFFAYADPELVNQIKQARLQKQWEPSPTFSPSGRDEFIQAIAIWRGEHSVIVSRQAAGSACHRRRGLRQSRSRFGLFQRQSCAPFARSPGEHAHRR